MRVHTVYLRISLQNACGIGTERKETREEDAQFDVEILKTR